MAEKLIQYWPWIAFVHALFGIALWVGLLQDRYQTSKSFKGLYGSGSEFEFGFSDIVSFILLTFAGILPFLFFIGFALLAWLEDHNFTLFSVKLNSGESDYKQPLFPQFDNSKWCKDDTKEERTFREKVYQEFLMLGFETDFAFQCAEASDVRQCIEDEFTPKEYVEEELSNWGE